MTKFLGLVSLMCVFWVGAVDGQSKATSPISQLPSGDPFKIGRGSSFSASGPQGTLPSAQPSGDTERDKIEADFREALDIVRNNHINGGKLALNDLVKSSITSSLHTLDPHSNYFDAAEYESMLQEEQSEYSGIGATIVNYEKSGVRDTFVIATFRGSPAAKAHLRFGDRIISVDDHTSTGKDSIDVRDLVRGKDGSTVRLKIERADTGSIETVDIKRGIVPQPSIPDHYMIRPGVGFIDMSDGFNYSTSSELAAALKDLHRQGMTSLVIDLRENPGGILEQAVKTAEQFLPAGSVIVSQQGRYRIDNRVWKSTNKAPETMPLTVLVNENTASASEIVAGALQDHDRALIIGEKTFGKGLVQNVINLPYGAGLTLTAAKYYTPSGRSIQRNYSNSDIYAYFNNHTDLPDSEKVKFEARTSTNRKVYGGDGIMPDEKVTPDKLSTAQISLLDPIFFFSRDLINGRIPGLENYGATVRTSSRPGGDAALSDVVITAFGQYAASNPSLKIPARTLTDQGKFIRTRLAYNLTMSAFGSVAANQVFVQEDPQVAKALESLPRAQQLAASAAKSKRIQR